MQFPTTRQRRVARCLVMRDDYTTRRVVLCCAVLCCVLLCCVAMYPLPSRGPPSLCNTSMTDSRACFLVVACCCLFLAVSWILEERGVVIHMAMVRSWNHPPPIGLLGEVFERIKHTYPIVLCCVVLCCVVLCCVVLCCVVLCSVVLCCVVLCCVVFCGVVLCCVVLCCVVLCCVVLCCVVL